MSDADLLGMASGFVYGATVATFTILAVDNAYDDDNDDNNANDGNNNSNNSTHNNNNNTDNYK